MNRAAISVLITVLASACSSAPVASPSPTGTPTAAPTASPTAAPTRTPTAAPTASPTATPAALRELNGRVAGSDNSDGTYPAYTVQAPAPWFSNGFFVLRSAGVIGLSVWDVVQVPTDPCSWKSTLTTPGPTVDDLVAALVAQKTRNATTPTDVSLAGHRGSYLEWSTPQDAVVTGDADFQGCDDPGNGHRDFVSWFGVGGSERYQQAAGQIDRLWILDVNGQRLVVDATYMPTTPPAQLVELRRIAVSLRFDEP